MDAKTLTIVVLAAAVLVLAGLLVFDGPDASGGAPDDPLYDWFDEEGRLTALWKGTETRALDYVDKDGNGVFEIMHWYDRQGRRVRSAEDANQNGVEEVTWIFLRGEAWGYMNQDTDEDGTVEARTYRAENGTYERWLDEDQDGRWDARERVAEADGKVLRRDEATGEGGWTWKRVR